MGVYRNGMAITIEHFPDKKLPKLCVRFDGENCIYSVASFKDEETAKWFMECLCDEFLAGLFAEED